MNQTITIQKTNNYKLFKGIVGNRNLYKRHIAELTSSIMNRNMLAFNPIIVNREFQIIDGQHRFSVAKNNNLDVYYVVLDEAGLKEVQNLNSTNLKWSMTDYLNSYVARGFEKYIRFQDYLSEYNLSTNQGLIFLYADNSADRTLVFKRGLLDFTDEEMERAEFTAGLREDLKPHFLDTGYNRATFLYALNILVRQGQGKAFLKKLQLSGKPLRSLMTQKEWIRVFEDILNYNRKLEHITLAM